MLGLGLSSLMQSVPLLCVKAFRDTDLDSLSATLLGDCAILLVGVIALIPNLRQTMNTCWLSIGER